MAPFQLQYREFTIFVFLRLSSRVRASRWLIRCCPFVVRTFHVFWMIKLLINCKSWPQTRCNCTLEFYLTNSEPLAGQVKHDRSQKANVKHSKSRRAVIWIKIRKRLSKTQRGFCQADPTVHTGRVQSLRNTKHTKHEKHEHNIE